MENKHECKPVLALLVIYESVTIEKKSLIRDCSAPGDDGVSHVDSDDQIIGLHRGAKTIKVLKKDY